MLIPMGIVYIIFFFLVLKERERVFNHIRKFPDLVAKIEETCLTENPDFEEDEAKFELIQKPKLDEIEEILNTDFSDNHQLFFHNFCGGLIF